MAVKKKIGIIFNEQQPASRRFAEKLAKALDGEVSSVWVCSTGREDIAQTEMPSTHFVITVGGDGTILRAARSAVHHGVPILGVNLGKLGFMTELKAEEALERVPELLAGGGWTEERALLEVQVVQAQPPKRADMTRRHPLPQIPLLALNDVVVGREVLSKVIYVEAHVDGVHLATFKGDGVIVATATGSTGYALAAGGPILYPQSKDIIIKPICPHLTFGNAVVLHGDSQAKLIVRSDHRAIVSIDGQIEYTVYDGDAVHVRRSARVARFLRGQSASYFYSTLTQRLGLHKSLPFGPSEPQ